MRYQYHAHSYGRPYLCPQSCFLSPRLGSHHGYANGTHMLGIPWDVVNAKPELKCPFW
jgi:hypothetical protein